MIYTNYSTSINFEELVFDPNGDFDLSDDRREQMEQEWRCILFDYIDDLLAPWDAYVLGNGEIVINADRVGEFSHVARDIFNDIATHDYDKNHAFFHRWTEIERNENES